MADKYFPDGFDDLERFAPKWVIGDVVAKQRKRAESDLATIKAFYDALYPEMDRIIGYLNSVPIDGMSEQDKNLYHLVGMWNEVSHPIDLNWGETDEFWSFSFDRVQLFERSPAD